MATPIITITVTYRCSHTATQPAYPATAAQLVASAASWLCKDCLQAAPAKRYGRGRQSSRFPLIVAS